MKIVTYNVNGLKPRVSQFGSLKKLLDSLDVDIICLQETKLARQELRADLVRTEGYESFFSCTRTYEKGRTGYSGVATFCRVKSAFSSDEVALPISAEEGFTGVLENFPVFGPKKNECAPIVKGLENFSTEELLKIDGEGRCIITDHGHFVLFNVYGPRAGCDDTERVQFKLKFYNAMQKRWESLLSQGRRIFVVGDLNIAPAAIDRCDAGPDFEKNEFRAWFRSLLVRNGGSFYDVFREKHPDRRDAYTCWATNSGAEEFNFGSRIDHILSSGPCLHDAENQGHSLVTCHVQECDILDQFKRWKPGNAPSWKGGRNVKLEGSDHVPVYMSLVEIPSIQQHNTPSISMRYCPQVYGSQQTLVSMFTRTQPGEDISLSGVSTSNSEDHIAVKSCSQHMKRPLSASKIDSTTKSLSSSDFIKKSKHSKGSQLSLKSFFQKTVVKSNDVTDDKNVSCKTFVESADFRTECELKETEDGSSQTLEEDKTNVALVEWQRIQQLMQTSIPICKGHNEQCVPRVVKKAGPNLGRRFYVCARSEGPASNPEANCGFFKWATTTKSKSKR